MEDFITCAKCGTDKGIKLVPFGEDFLARWEDQLLTGDEYVSGQNLRSLLCRECRGLQQGQGGCLWIG